MQIDSLVLDSPFILAPLAGYSDLPFRLLCREYGAGLCYSEMISCHGLVYQQEKTRRYLLSTPAERPVAMQLFGADPKVMAEAAALLCREPIDCIDINMGCPVRKVIKKGAGAALMRQPQLAAAIIRGVVERSDKPVTVKIRAGWNHDQINAPQFAQMAEECGAAAVAVHGRTWSDGFSGRADWQVVAAVKQAVAIPVIGNGDILSHRQGLERMRETGCDAIMIGRGALGAPWIFSNGPDQPTVGQRLAAAFRHLELINNHFTTTSKQGPPPATGGHLGRVKNHLGRYVKGIAGASRIRQQIYEAPTLAALFDLLARQVRPTSPPSFHTP